MDWIMTPAAIALCAHLGVVECQPEKLYPAAWRAKLYDYQIGCTSELAPCRPLEPSDECLLVARRGAHWTAVMCRRAVRVSWGAT